MEVLGSDLRDESSTWKSLRIPRIYPIDIRPEQYSGSSQTVSNQRSDAVSGENADALRLVKHYISMQQRYKSGLQRSSYRVEHYSLHLPVVEGHETHRMNGNGEHASQQ